LLVSIPTMIDQSNESNPVDSHHLVFRAWLSRFGIGKEVYYTKYLTEGHPCLVAFDYGSENNVVSQRLVEKLQLPTTFSNTAFSSSSLTTFPYNSSIFSRPPSFTSLL